MQSLKVFEVILHFFGGQVVGGFEGPGAGPQYFRHLLVGNFIVIPHLKDQALFGRQAKQSFFEQNIRVYHSLAWGGTPEFGLQANRIVAEG